MEKMYRLTFASNGNSDLRSLIWVFVVRMKKLCILGCPKCANEDSNQYTVKMQTDLNLRTCPKIHFLTLRLQSSSHVLGRKRLWGGDSTAVSNWLKYSYTIRSHTDRLSVTTWTCAVEQSTRWYIPILRVGKYIQTMHDPYSLSVAFVHRHTIVYFVIF